MSIIISVFQPQEPIKGKIFANIQLPGFKIYYTTENSEPAITSKIYTAPISNKGLIKIKVFDARGRSSETIFVKK